MTVEVIISDGALSAAPEWRPAGAGAVVTFEGVVRPSEAGQPIVGLRYDVYEPMAQSDLERLAQQAIDQFGVLAIRVEHSRGLVAADECSFRLQMGAEHRQAALEAASWFIDAMKRDVPIWKHPVPAHSGTLRKALFPLAPSTVGVSVMNEPDRQLSHLDAAGQTRMVDVGDKPTTNRRAVAEGRVCISAELARAIQANQLAKGNLLEVARLAGIQAAKRTDELIPLCHSLTLEDVQVEAALVGDGVLLRATVQTTGKTGVEMEALTAVAVAALTVIDMGKSLDKQMVIESIRLIEKTGGRSGDFHLDQGTPQ